jgi:hypothetical protein
MAITMGSGSTAESQAAVGALSIQVLGESVPLTADFVMAESVATCTGVSGFSTVTNLRVGPVTIPVSGTPNQIVSAGALNIVINEQYAIPNGIAVNALDITDLLIPGVQIIVAHAESDISCANPCQSEAHDFVTGG